MDTTFIFLQSASFKVVLKPTINNEACFVGVGGTKVVCDDALVTALVGESYMPQVQDRGVLHHTSTCPGCLRCSVCPHMGKVLSFCIAK